AGEGQNTAFPLPADARVAREGARAGRPEPERGREEGDREEDDDTLSERGADVPHPDERRSDRSRAEWRTLTCARRSKVRPWGGRLMPFVNFSSRCHWRGCSIVGSGERMEPHEIRAL